MEISEENLDSFIAERDFKAINVTMPYKEMVIRGLDYVDDNAKQIGAVNTIVNRMGKLYGYNTDFMGMARELERFGIDVKDKSVAILGSGGTSKTAAAVAKHLGAKEILKVIGRTTT